MPTRAPIVIRAGALIAAICFMAPSPGGPALAEEATSQDGAGQPASAPVPPIRGLSAPGAVVRLSAPGFRACDEMAAQLTRQQELLVVTLERLAEVQRALELLRDGATRTDAQVRALSERVDVAVIAAAIRQAADRAIPAPSANAPEAAAPQAPTHAHARAPRPAAASPGQTPPEAGAARPGDAQARGPVVTLSADAMALLAGPRPQAAETSQLRAAVRRTYTVKPNDTLGDIARRMGVTPQAIARANNLASLDLIVPGDVLVIPEVSR